MLIPSDKRGFTAVTLLLVLFPLLYSGAVVRAVPANPTVITLKQADGTNFQALIRGDEWRNWMETLDGYTILFDRETGNWIYAESGPGGGLAASGQAVKKSFPAGVEKHLKPADSLPPPGTPNNPMPGIVSTPPVQGTHNVLVLLVQFSDRSLVGTDASDWNDKFFEATNSIKDYYEEVSYGQITLNPATESQGTSNDGIVIVTLAYPHPNPSSTGNKNRQIVHDAIIAADLYVDYSNFDTNGDGYLSTDELHLVTIVAGYENSYGGASACTPGVWAHRWSLGFWYDEDGDSIEDPGERVDAPLSDGVYVGHHSGGPSGSAGGYTQEGEWHCTSGNPPGHAATMGPATHELGHDMGTGVPDLYDTDGSSNGIGNWGLQAGGSWNGTSLLGDTPAHWSAWAKWMMGLIAPTQITSPTTGVSIPQVETATGASHGVYQLLDNPGGVDWDWGSSGTGEYFLLENRQLVGYDSALPGSGLLIWHIYEAAPGDKSANATEGTTPPGNPRLVVLEQADGLFDLECYSSGGCNRGDDTDPWYNSSTGFDDTSTPNSKLYDGSSTGAYVRNISDSGSIMTADLGVPSPGTDAVFRVTREGNVYADQAYYGAGFYSGSADIAEAIQVTEPVEPGDVVELDPARPGHYRKARIPYSNLVGGVISTQPAFRLGISKSEWENHPNKLTSFLNTPLRLEGISLTRLSISSKLNEPNELHELYELHEPKEPNEPHEPNKLINLVIDLGSFISNWHLVPDTWYLTTDLGHWTLDLGLPFDFEPPSTLTLPGFEKFLFHQLIAQNLSGKPLLALMGVVPVKATAENGPIQPGDLLTTSSKPGYVMVCKDKTKCAGAIVGKALEPLTDGVGLIKMLVMR